MQIERILEKFDELLQAGNKDDACHLLEGALVVASDENDMLAFLCLLNELMGFHRENGPVEKAVAYAEAAKEFLENTEMMASELSAELESAATTLLNMASVYRVAGDKEQALSCYQKVAALYEQLLPENDMRRAAFYNNVSLLHQEMGNFREAKGCLANALEVVKANTDVSFEEAVTYANLANTCLVLEEDEEAKGYFLRSIEIFEKRGIRDNHYAAALSGAGTFFYHKKEYEKAAEYFRTAMICVKESVGENEGYARLSENLAACMQAMEAEHTEDAQEEDAADSDKPNVRKQISGLELCKAYYETYGIPMIREKFPEWESRIAVGLCGEGSDCFGLDDEYSRDHDWGPGFSMWLNDEDAAQIGEQLQAAYEQLPREFMGFRRQNTEEGKGRTGVCTVRGFYKRLLGWDMEEKEDGPDFRQVSDAALAAAINGCVFRDDSGLFMRIRAKLQKGYPADILYLKVAEAAAGFSQGAQYNYARCMMRGDAVTAQICLADGIKEAMRLLLILCGKGTDEPYPIHDKWLYTRVRGIESCAAESALIEKILTENQEPDKISALTDELGVRLSERMYAMDLVGYTTNYPEVYAAELVKKASLIVLTEEELAKEIAKLEFKAFDRVQNTGGRADCQNNWPTFAIMRMSQYLTWTKEMMAQYYCDFESEFQKGRNMIEEKYGRMMESTFPEEYARIKDSFPPVSDRKRQVIEAIVKIQVGFMEEFAEQYPNLAGNARSIHTYDDRFYNTSYETYLRGELGTYSDKMLELYARFVIGISQNGQNLARLTMQNSVRMYGYDSLEEAEAKA